MDDRKVGMHWRPSSRDRRIALSPFPLPSTPSNPSPIPDDAIQMFLRTEVLEESFLSHLARGAYGWAVVRVAFRDTQAPPDGRATWVTRWVASVFDYDLEEDNGPQKFSDWSFTL